MSTSEILGSSVKFVLTVGFPPSAAVLGGASLFAGIGTVFPGTVLGTVMIQMIQAGLVFTQVDLYIQPLVMALIIFLAVFIDSFRNVQLKKLERRHIMKQE